MLEILRSIVQEVGKARDLDQALAVTVQRVKAALGVDVCSVYMRDKVSDELALMASEGLKAEAVGRVRLSFEEGLVGLVAQRAEPVNLDEAPDHPRYRYFPESGEERYHAFLGVPIIHHREILGVLVVQQYVSHRYSEDTVTLLVTIAAQLAGAIAHAEASGGIDALRRSSGVDEGRPLNGLPGSPGVAVGVALVIRPYDDIYGVPDRVVTDVEAELERLQQAVAAVKQEVRAMVANMVATLPASEIALFDAYLLMLDSDSFLGDIREGIRQGNWAPGALREVVSAHVQVFREMDDPYLRERAEDVRDLGQRILRQLDDQPKREINYPANTILVGEEITASALAEVPLNRLAGIVAAQGSSTSHTAILARALGVPAVLGVKDLPVLRVDGLSMIIDGYAGQIYINPPKNVKREYRRLQQEERELSKDLQGLRDLEPVTLDGKHIALYANTGLMSDVTPSLNSGAEGVGLYRTEFPFLIRECFPGEEEQYRVYRHVLEAFAPNSVTMRTLDIGGDKQLPYFPIEEDNPFLGWRGIRITLDHPEIMLTQIRAMLRANMGMGNLRLLLPMISALSEVDEALALIKRAHSGLLEEGQSVTLPPIGVMVEVPSVIFQIDGLAKRVDFLSIGSNDLTQYMLAVDRNNARVAELYDSLHPAMLRTLRLIVKEAQRHQLPVSVCGEMAGDPMAALVLIGLGINSLSMSASSVPRIKWVVRSFSKRSAMGIVTKVMKLQDPQAIRAYLRKRIDRAGLGGLVRGGK